MSYKTELQSNNNDLQVILDAIGEMPTTDELLADVVKHSAQSLTEEQKAQARANIGIEDGGGEEIQQFTSLPSSGTILTANAEYRVSSPVSTYIFSFPISGDVYVRFTTAATYAISFASGTGFSTRFIGEILEFKASTTYELMARDGVVTIGEVVTA